MSGSVRCKRGVMQRSWLTAMCCLLSLPWCGFVLAAAELPRAGTVFQARDTLDTAADGLQDAQQCLEGLRWKPADFEVTLESGLKRSSTECLMMIDSSMMCTFSP